MPRPVERARMTNLFRLMPLTIGLSLGACKSSPAQTNPETNRPVVAQLDQTPANPALAPHNPVIPNRSDIFNINRPLPEIASAAPPPPPRPESGTALGQIQEDFNQGALRYWYAFGQFNIAGTQGSLRVTGNATEWSGFGANTNNGSNGKAFDATGCRYLEFDIRGSLSGRMKVELIDFSGKTFEHWFETLPSNNHMRIRLENVSGQISKMQWVAGPGTRIDLNITNIRFTPEEAAAAQPAAVASVSDADPIMAVTPVSGARSGGRYYQAVTALANYFLTNAGNPPNATRQTTIDGISARAAYHLFEDQASHICNGGGTTSEAQALFFNFMVLYGAMTGNPAPAREAYAYLRYFMMPHDGAESPQLPDSRLGVGGNYPFLSHWLVDVSGEAQARTCPDGRPGSGVFGEGETYNMYDPIHDSAPYATVAQTPEGQVDLTLRQQGGGRHAASFGSATDADQWLADGAYWAALYGMGEPQAFLMNLRKGLTEGLNPSDAQNYPNVMRFAVYWGEDNPPQMAFKGTTQQLYAGYQAPEVWEIMGRHQWAQNIVKFLKDAQDTFSQRYGVSGLFMPVFKDGEFGFSGDDPNTHWMGFQYRAFAHLANYYYITGDAEAKAVLDKFVAWYQSKKSMADGRLSIPLEINNSGSSIGSVRRSGYGPNEFGLMAQGLVLMAARNQDTALRQDAEQLLDYTVAQRAANGSFPYVDPLPENSGVYGFHNAEVGIAMGLYSELLEH